MGILSVNFSPEDLEWMRAVRAATEYQGKVWDAIRKRKTAHLRLYIRVEDGKVNGSQVIEDETLDLGQRS